MSLSLSPYGCPFGGLFLYVCMYVLFTNVAAPRGGGGAVRAEWVPCVAGVVRHCMKGGVLSIVNSSRSNSNRLT
jgi:hypothetical protein